MAVTQPAAGNKPLYQGIIDDIRARIGQRQLHPGDRLPSIGQLADRYNVSVITAKRAVAELQTLGFVRSVQGKGTFVTRSAGRRAEASAEDAPLKSVALLTNNLDARSRRTFFAAIWGSIEQACDDLGLEFRLQVIPDGGSGFHVDLTFSPDPTEGLIFLAPSFPYTVLHLIQDRTIPTVMIDSVLSFSHCVTTDNYDGMRNLIRHVRELGHQRIALAHFHPRSPNPTNENERTQAFRQLADEYNLAAEVMPAEDVDAIVNRVKDDGGPTCVMFTQDDPAVWFVEAARKAGLRVPEDVSVTGFDGWRHAEGRAGGITTIDVDLDGLGRAAVKTLTDLSVNRACLPQWHRVPGSLRTGPTTAPPPAT